MEIATMNQTSGASEPVRRLAPLLWAWGLERALKTTGRAVLCSPFPADVGAILCLSRNGKHGVVVLGEVRVVGCAVEEAHGQFEVPDYPGRLGPEEAYGEKPYLLTVELVALPDQPMAVAKDALAPAKAVQETIKRVGPLSYVRINGQWIFPVLDRSVPHQTLTLMVFDPSKLDAHKHEISADLIELASHEWMANYRQATTRPPELGATGIGAFHEIPDVKDVHVVETFIVRWPLKLNGKAIPIGAWLVVLWVLNPEFWAMVERGEVKGISPDGDAWATVYTADSQAESAS